MCMGLCPTRASRALEPRYKFCKHNSKKQDVCDWKGCFTLSGMKTNIVELVNVSQHKGAAVGKCMIWMDNYFTVKTADNTDGSLEALCCSKQNQMVAPATVLRHAL